ncbi:G-type lectin S-receptor-like serine/threonine-protein kinase At4g27290 isoform X3 [Curcuma longa]|uniref:G-type lectin S-receptor-like serine/threonine-protein kinase At4g27290 isoform X3 n=1 Tax=Curcuma longa TaxID=136217 RepID=UPI003D9E8D7D
MRRIIFLLFGASLFSFSTADDTLTPGRPLTDDGEASLISAGGKFQLGFFSPAGSSNRYVGIWFRNISVDSVVWIANRRRPIAGTSGSLSLTANGTLLIADGNGTVYWTSSTDIAVANPSVQLLDDANLVVREAGGDRNSYPAWQSHDFPTNMHLPGMKIGWNLTSGLNRQLTAWTSATDPAPGNYTFGIEKQGNAQEFVWQGTQPRWRSGPWNGLYFSGLPGIGSESLVRYEFAVDEQEVAAWFAVNNPSVIVRGVLMPDGLLRSEVWMEETQTWSVWVYVPMDPCDVFSPCGPNAVCYPNAWPMCRCLPGFRLRNPRNWDVNGNPSDGCVRKTPLDCRNATDGFFQQSSVKLPDTTASAVNRSMSLEDCRNWCLGNCSCTAYASANLSTGSESGCMIWTSGLADIKFFYGSSSAQPLHVRLAAPDLAAVESGQRRMRTIIITISCAAVLFLFCAACCVWAAKKKEKSKYQPISSLLGFYNSTYQLTSGVLFFAEHRSDEEEVAEENLDLPVFDLGTIAEATGNFCIDNKLGEGGFGPVYKGKLKEGQEIAVKRLSKMSTQGTDEFKNEVMVIAKLQHRNLVRLLGCCIQGGERMLIYEYMLNGSLDTFLFDKDRCRLLDWRMRYNIILGIVRGLLYLHHDSRYRIIHRDLKTSNILLDKDMNPKISDFGMAKLFGGDETTGNTKRVAGTYGYMSPEYAMNGIFSVKSDVFSFGVLMLEIITGKKNNGAYQSVHHQNLLGEIWSLWKENRVLEIVDDSIHHSCPFDEVLTCIKVGLLCVQERSEDRPIMSSVLQMLGSNSSLLPEPKQPGFVVTGNQNDNDSSGALLSINRLSVTILEGR